MIFRSNGIKIGDYFVKWAQSGWSYAVPYVYKRFGPLGMFRKLVWTGSPMLIEKAYQINQEDKEKWFNAAITGYEKYSTSNR